jgi:hypothetical protein
MPSLRSVAVLLFVISCRFANAPMHRLKSVSQRFAGCVSSDAIKVAMLSKLMKTNLMSMQRVLIEEVGDLVLGLAVYLLVN